MIFYTNINLDFYQTILQLTNLSTYITTYAKLLITANSLVLFFAIFLKHLTEYDRVCHEGLLSKLKENGIGDSLLLWLNRYLENRKQKVIIQA